jgi:hypothetical protein
MPVAGSPGGNNFVGAHMVVRPRLRPASAFSAILMLALLGFVPIAASAAPLDEAACQRLKTEQQALNVLGVDKQVEKGAGWAKEHLTVADLNLVKRYVDVFEQIIFRCEKVVALVEPQAKDEGGDDDDDDAAVASPPMPERKTNRTAKASAAPAAVSQPKANSAAKTGKATLGTTNASATAAGTTGKSANSP